MKTDWLKPIVFCLLLAFVFGLLPPAAKAQGENNQDPILLIKIRNLDRLLGDIERLMPQSGKQMQQARAMLQGTDWIDTERSITASVIMEGVRNKLVLMVPFSKANSNFQMMLNATAGKDYYIAGIPPQPDYAVSPALEDNLLKASVAPTIGSITLEASAQRLLTIIEPQMNAALAKMEQTPPPNPSGLPQPNPREMLNDMLNFLRQANAVRLGMDFSGNSLSLQYDIQALPNTLLANTFVDPHKDTRLMNYVSDMPIQFRSRAPKMSEMMELAKMLYGRLYQQLGINLDDMAELTKAFTGELAGGFGIDANGISLEAIYILQPGINGESFLRDTYLPWFERYNQQITDRIAKQKGGSQAPLYTRTEDSVVDGIKVMGIKPNLSAIVPPSEKAPPLLDKFNFEMRVAAKGDMMLVASSDARLSALIGKSRNLTQTAAQSSTSQLDIKLGDFFRGIQSLMPPKGIPVRWPEDLGNMAIEAGMNNGTLSIRTNIPIDEIAKLIAATKTQSVKQ